MQTKTVCQLDSNKYFVSTTIADKDPLDAGFLIPAGCIDTAPPEQRENKVAQWDSEKWHYVSDYRGQTVYSTDDGREIAITEIGELPDNTTTEPRPTQYHSWQGGAWTLTDDAIEQQLSDAKTAKLIAVAQSAQRFIATVTRSETVPEFERLTWPAQAREAELWAADNSVETPTLAAIANQRGVDLDVLREKALQKARAYQTLVATIAGQRQRIEDQINAAQTVADVDAIDINFTVS
ncbi:tail fiber assembly protein [Cardiobacteriaceae bacterium TAE3-ERU3]|nr:tail fiber assembly protein [Cardiobacteriaceae bacterium TAE3-ERU3]